MSKKIPRFRAIAQTLRAQVMSGELPAGTALPSRRNLVEKFETSRVTIDKVIEILTAEGFLEPSDRNRPPRVADISRYTATVQDRVENHKLNGRALGDEETSEILSVGMVPCPASLAPFLGVEPGTEVLRRERLNKIKGKPVATGHSYYPPEVTKRTPELREPKSIPTGSRELAAERMGSPQREPIYHVTSRLATDNERELLKLGTLAVVTETTRQVFLENGKVVEVAVKISEGKRPLRFRSSL